MEDSVVVLKRIETGDDGTFGTLTCPSGFQCYTVELPWRNNEREKSCIHAGEYKVTWEMSPTRKEETYRLQGVPGRDGILIHSANWAGDVDRGFKSQVLGCIAPGRSIDNIAGQKGVTSSRDALAGLIADLEKLPFTLSIRWAHGKAP